MSTLTSPSTASLGYIPSAATTSTTLPSLSRVSSLGQSLGMGSSGTTSSSVVSSGLGTGSAPSYVSSSSSTSYFGSSFFIWMAIAAVLALISVNGFSYYTTGHFLFGEEILTSLGSVTAGISTFVNNLMNSTEVGGKGVVEVSGETVKSTASIPDQIVNGSQVNQDPGKRINQTVATGAAEIGTNQTTQSYSPSSNSNPTPLETKINNANTQIATAQRDPSRDIDLSGPQPNETSVPGSTNSNIGYCYIGEYNGERGCVSVDDSTKCLSGNIFNTQDQCMKPAN